MEFIPTYLELDRDPALYFDVGKYSHFLCHKTENFKDRFTIKLKQNCNLSWDLIVIWLKRKNIYKGDIIITLYRKLCKSEIFFVINPKLKITKKATNFECNIHHFIFMLNMLEYLSVFL